MAHADGLEAHNPDAGLLDLLDVLQAGQTKRFARGSILHWQGDPVEHIIVVRSGAVKLFSISPAGRVYTYGILGAGALAGAAAYLLGKHHEMQAKALDDTEVLVFLPAEFERLLATDPRFSLAVMRKLAQGADGQAARVALETIRRLRAEFPANSITGGASNVSFGMPDRPALNASFLTAAAVLGLNAPITDPTNDLLHTALLTADLFLGRDRRLRRYMQHYREAHPATPPAR
jgi:hypothetical protein